MKNSTVQQRKAKSPLWGFGGLLLTILPVALGAQNGVTISNFEVTEAHTVKFDLSWQAEGMPAKWSDSVWVFVDYNVAGTLTRLPLQPGAALLNPSAQGAGYGIVIEVPGNNRGVWVVGNARHSESSFSATVVLPFAPATVLNGACAYSVNYPPDSEWNPTFTEITFTGTPPYNLIIRNASSTASTTTNSPYTFPDGYRLVSFTDHTGAPGATYCAPSTAPESFTVSAATVCSGSPATLTATGGIYGTGSLYEWGTGTVGSGSFAKTTANTVSVSPTSNTTYWVRRNAAGCGTTTEKTSAVTVTAAANNGQAANACGCANGTVNCSGTCKTNSTYTTDDGVCGSCWTKYKRQRDACGTVVNEKYSLYEYNECKSQSAKCMAEFGCPALSHASCNGPVSCTSSASANAMCASLGAVVGPVGYGFCAVRWSYYPSQWNNSVTQRVMTTSGEYNIRGDKSYSSTYTPDAQCFALCVKYN